MTHDKKTIAIVGPMTGIPAIEYVEIFRAAQIAEENGYAPLNPLAQFGSSAQTAAHNRATFDYPETYLRTDAARIAAIADEAVMLPGWDDDHVSRLMGVLVRERGIPAHVINDETRSFEPRVQIVGLSGYARTGKDTVATIMCEHLGFQRRAFADALKSTLYHTDPFIEEAGESLSGLVDSLGWDGAKTRFPEVRTLLQRFGTEGVRVNIKDSIWVDKVLSDLPDRAKIAITDVRFPNEAQAIKDAGGEVWRIARPGVTAANGHISEIALDQWHFDRILLNDGDLYRLKGKVLKVFGLDHASLRDARPAVLSDDEEMSA